MYLFCFSSCGFLLQPISELVALLSELSGKVKSLEWDLETVKATFSPNVEELAKSREERHALEGELDQIRNVAQPVVSEVFRSAPSTSTFAIQLAEVPDEVQTLITDRLFYRTSGLLTSVAM